MIWFGPSPSVLILGIHRRARVSKKTRKNESIREGSQPTAVQVFRPQAVSWALILQYDVCLLLYIVSYTHIGKKFQYFLPLSFYHCVAWVGTKYANKYVTYINTSISYLPA